MGLFMYFCGFDCCYCDGRRKPTRSLFLNIKIWFREHAVLRFWLFNGDILNRHEKKNISEIISLFRKHDRLCSCFDVPNLSD